MPVRVNARLDDDLGRALARYQKKTGLTVTQVLERALDLFLSQETRDDDPARTFASTGFIGVAQGPPDLARNAKRHLSASLEKKR